MKKLSKLSTKENILFMAAFRNASYASPEDLLQDNFSYFDETDIQRSTLLSKHEIAGVISSLNKKNYIDMDAGDWFITDYALETMIEEGVNE